MKERFSIPGVGGIVVKKENGCEYILIQERSKKDAANIENGLIEIPAGKIREYENIYDCLRREVFEETGYRISEIIGEKEAKIIEVNNYKVLSYEPFTSSQNIEGHYPIMVQTFICLVDNNSIGINKSDESQNIRWIEKHELIALLEDNSKFYPMHLYTLKKYCNNTD